MFAEELKQYPRDADPSRSPGYRLLSPGPGGPRVEAPDEVALLK